MTPTRDLDLRCYFVTGAGDPARVVDTARAAVAGGAGVVQVRSKPVDARALTELTAAVADAVHEIEPRAKVLVDDRVDVALAVRARGHHVHGVHVGQDDLPVRDVRALLGPDAVIGLTTGTLELVRAAHEVADALDYLGCGPFRATPTKDSGRTPIGLAGYPDLVDASPVPLIAIGDVTADDASDLATTGVDGVAVVRGLMDAADPAAYARRIVEAF